MKAATLTLATGIAAGALILAPAASAAALPSGDYNFNLPGMNAIPVHIEETGFETIKLTAPSGTVVNMVMNRRGDRYQGLSHDPHGAMCGTNPMLADVFYKVDTDGNNGVVEVLGQPCGPGAAISPLIFSLTSANP